MISLFLDTCNSNISIALISDNTVLNSIEFINDNTLSEKLLPNIDKLLKDTNLSIRNISRIYVSVGPGSFTGIRIGVSVAKTIAWGMKIDIIPVSSLEVMASTNSNKPFICPLIDARRGNVYTAIYDSNLGTIKEDSYINYDMFLENNKDIIKDIHFVSYDSYKNSDLVAIDYLKVINKHLNDLPINPHKVNPVYLKLTEAEEKLNDK